MPRKSFNTLADNLHDVMVETLPTMVDKHIKEQVMKQVPEQVRKLSVLTKSQEVKSDPKSQRIKSSFEISKTLGCYNSDDDNNDVEKDDKDGDADDEGDDHMSDTQDADDEDVKTESDEDDIYKYKIRVRKDDYAEMTDAKVEESDKGKEKVTNAAKEEAEKTSEVKDDTKKTELPPLSWRC
ncbi:hypothetical protein Tco_0637089 [Tanacetum coccineum]